MANKALKLNELEYIRQNCMSMSDGELAEHLGRDKRTVSAARKRIGVFKGQGGKLTTVETGKVDSPDGSVIIASRKLDENSRKEFFKTQLANTLYYETLQQQLTKNEIDFYLEEWGSLCYQFEDIVATEKRQIDELIKAEIMGNRILRNIKITEIEIEKIQQEIESLRSKKDMTTDEEAQERDNNLMLMVKTMMAQSHQMSADYQKNVDIKNKLLEHLNGRRRDRIDHLKKAGTTVLGIIAELRNRETREIQGRHMELERLAKEKKKSEWRKPVQFPDGTMDCILLDDKSELPKKEIVRIEEIPCKTLHKYETKEKSNILIIEDDNRRIQFFQDVFANHNIEYASNADKAIEKLSKNNYDLICLDYDLGLEQKSEEISKLIASGEKRPDILIHSMNPEGSKKLTENLVSFKNVETMPFEELVKIKIGAKNA